MNDPQVSHQMDLFPPPPWCQAASWPGVVSAGLCVGMLTSFPSFDDVISTVTWSLCQHHYDELTLCGGCGRFSALGPYTSQCMHCISAAHHGEAMWWVKWKPGQR